MAAMSTVPQRLAHAIRASCATPPIARGFDVWSAGRFHSWSECRCGWFWLVRTLEVGGKGTNGITADGVFLRGSIKPIA